MSRPMRARGLKRLMKMGATLHLQVAPHAGAWIETPSPQRRRMPARVAPHAGAWIETADFSNISTRSSSRPMRARGLKPSRATCIRSALAVAPHAGAWIETTDGYVPPFQCLRSRPMRARGLKPDLRSRPLPFFWSRPMRARGLKQSSTTSIDGAGRVAPHAGAWIETVQTQDC